MSEELKPCAHCGEKAELIDDRLGWYVSCGGCGSTVMGERALEPETQEDSNQTDWDYYEQSAIQKWNKRHIPEGYRLVQVIKSEKFILQEPDCNPIYDELHAHEVSLARSVTPEGYKLVPMIVDMESKLANTLADIMDYPTYTDETNIQKVWSDLLESTNED